MRGMIRFAWIACVVASLAACATKDEALKPAELVSFESTAAVKSRWNASLGGNIRATGIGPFKTGRIYSRSISGNKTQQRFFMAFDDDTLYATNRLNKVYAINRSSGKTRWTQTLKQDIGAGVGVSDALLFIGSLKGDVIALDRETGDIVWSAKVPTEVVSPPQGNGSEVLVKSIDGRLSALDAKDGTLLWNYDHPQPLLTFRSQASPLLVDDQAFVAFDNGQLLSFGTKEGDLRWSVRVSQPQGVTELERAVDLDITPIAAGPFIISGGANGRLIAVSRGAGKITWAEDASIFNELAYDDSALFYVDEKSHLHSLSLSSGKLIWDSEVLHRREVSSPEIVGQYLAAIDGSNILHVFDRTNGELAARRSLPGNGYSTPMLSDGNILYIFSDNGLMNAYEIEPK